MRLRLTPRDTTFFDLFAAQAVHLVTGANLLGEMLGADRADAARRSASASPTRSTRPTRRRT